MTSDESRALLVAGFDDLVMNAALDPRIPMSMTEAHNAPLSLLVQADILTTAWDRIEKRKTLMRHHNKAVNRG